MPPHTSYPIEIVDLSLPKEDISNSIRKACIEAGFFYLINHGIDPSLIDKFFVESKKFFRLPLEEKMKSLQDENNRGYTPFMEETLDPENQSKGDTKEGYYIGTEISNDDPLSKKPLHGPNNWPSQELLPEWRQTMTRYHEETKNLGLHLLTYFALALNLPERYFFDNNFLNCPIVSLRPLHYLAEKSSPEDGVFGAGAHSDYGLITLLISDVQGLQICKNKDEKDMKWEDIPPIPNCFIVNIGDMLERWTNNLFRSTLHRVINHGEERYSAAVFFETDFDSEIECLPTCFDEKNPPKYKPVIAGEYLLSRYKSTQTFDNIKLEK